MTPQQQADQLLRTAQLHHQAGRLQDAETTYRQALLKMPNHPRALFMLGAIAHQSGKLAPALEWLAKAAVADPAFPETYFLTGLIQHQQGQLEPAIAAYRKTLSLQPNHAKALNNLGRAQLDSARVTEGIQTLRNLISLAPQHASAYSNLGDGLRMQRNFDAAVAAYKQAIAVQPNFAEAHGNLGAALAEKGELVSGIEWLHKALALNPRLASAHYNLAKAFQEHNQFEEAIEHCRLFLQIRPEFADGQNLLGSLIGICGRVPEAIAAQRRAIALRPNHAASASNLLLSLHYLDEFEPETVFKAHLDWAAQYANFPAHVSAPHNNDKNPDRRLRVGYVSPNYQRHSVAYFLEPVLAAHDRAKVEIFCYADLLRPDDMTRRFEALADHWRDITAKSDAAVAEMIRRDSIDILVDLAGHTADNRMVVFAMKPAPIQFSWLGYPDTTGLATMDYRVTDAVADPPGEADSRHTEKLLRFDAGCWAYAPPADSPAVGEAPFGRNGFITFGSFNNLPKVTPRVLESWGKILSAVPGSRLLIKALGLSANTGRDYVLSHLSQHGIDANRVELLGWAPSTSSHLDLYNRIDIALDTHPYNGTTTTCEALWMGVPVVTFTGRTHAARVGASLLWHAGVPELVADEAQDYVTRATELARDSARLQSLRATLRLKLATSSVCDGVRLARQLENAFQTAWRESIRANAQHPSNA